MRVSLKVYHRRFKEIEREIHEVERNKRGWQLAIGNFSFLSFF